jgi:hypothetical protein
MYLRIVSSGLHANNSRFFNSPKFYFNPKLPSQEAIPGTDVLISPSSHSSQHPQCRSRSRFWECDSISFAARAQGSERGSPSTGLPPHSSIHDAHTTVSSSIVPNINVDPRKGMLRHGEESTSGRARGRCGMWIVRALGGGEEGASTREAEVASIVSGSGSARSTKGRSRRAGGSASAGQRPGTRFGGAPGWRARVRRL